MARSRREWSQCELKEAVGAEVWVIVRHRRGWFRVPADTPISDVLRGVEAGWDRESGKVSSSPGRINVNAAEWAMVRAQLAYFVDLAKGELPEHHLATTPSRQAQ